ncbi:hypothetical protein F2Q68_00033016 [Brassica cretica]|uniref:Threonine dehydratase n=1 Tax=Brassica cretica TaxID=69181 RepID=A0A8S9G473_BRACR|nr:hypothetical protein F2Q68_00033016 [Brassica cretica]
MDSVRLPTAPSSHRTQMLGQPLHHIPLPRPCNRRGNLRLKPVIGTNLSRNHVSPVAVITRDETTSVSPLASPQPRLKVSPSSLQYPAGYLGAVPERTSDSENGSIAEAMEYLTNILSTKVYDVAIETPLHLAEKLSERLGVRLFLKREDLQPVFSFKLRGAYNMMVKLPAEQLAKGVICSSAGNHAQGVALSAAKLGCTSVIVMPRTTPEIKWQSVENLGATVVLVGDSYDEAQAFAKQRAEEEGLTFIPPFDHPDVIAGQGTVGMEITRQAKGPLHAIFVPIGGGGLIAGIASYVKRVCPEVKIIGVEPADANTMALSLHHGERVILDQVGGFADGVAVKVVGEETFRISRKLVDGVVLVTRDAICASIKDMFEEQRNILEPAGALAIAGAEAYCKYYGLKDVNVVAITSGANMNFDKLRIVTELANVGRQQEAVLATSRAYYASPICNLYRLRALISHYAICMQMRIWEQPVKTLVLAPKKIGGFLRGHRMNSGGTSASYWPWFKKMEEIVSSSLATKCASGEDRSVGVCREGGNPEENKAIPKVARLH